MDEKIVETKQCKFCGTSFAITDVDLAFYEKISPILAWKKYAIPSPTLCPDCRQQRRLAQQNMYKLYQSTCSKTGAPMISMYSPDKGLTVYNQKTRRSDVRNPLDYGKAYDFSKMFFQQFDELNKKIPHVNLNTDFTIDENSSFCNYAGQQKDCYLMFHSSLNEKCFFGTGIKECKNVVDALNCFYSNEMYECIDCFNCYNLLYSQACKDCNNSYYLQDCIWCSNCFSCKNLINQSYCIENKVYSKEEYEEKIQAIISRDTTDVLKDTARRFFRWLPEKSFHGINNERVSWDNIINCKYVYESFDIQESESMKYCERIYNWPNKNCYDVDQFGLRMQKIYECSEVWFDATDVHFSISCRNNIFNIFYCFEVISSKNLFGCIWLRNKEYCILNKQYTKEEYEKLVPQIIEKMIADPAKDGAGAEWWEFFPSHISPFWYNETVAMEYYPFTKEEALAKWFKRSDYEAPFPKTDAKDVIICEVSSKPFRIIPQELAFYNKHNLPLPTKHPDVRHAERIKLRNPRKLRNRTCSKCGTDMQTTYAPDLPDVAGRPEVVYCEQCYNKEIYG